MNTHNGDYQVLLDRTIKLIDNLRQNHQLGGKEMCACFQPLMWCNWCLVAAQTSAGQLLDWYYSQHGSSDWLARIAIEQQLAEWPVPTEYHQPAIRHIVVCTQRD